MSDSHSPLAATPAAPVGDAHASPSGDHASHAHHEMHLKLYWGIGGVLIFLTGVTVGLSYVDFGSTAKNIVFAMLLATLKVSLVGAIFMHLKGEKPTVWRFLYFTAFFVAGLFLLTLLAWADPIFGSSNNTY